jgi:hypothetical protein
MPNPTSPESPSSAQATIALTTTMLMADIASTNAAVRMLLTALEPDVSEKYSLVFAAAVLMIPSAEHEVARLNAAIESLRGWIEVGDLPEPAKQVAAGSEALSARLSKAIGVDAAMRSRAQERIAAAHKAKAAEQGEG